MDNKKEDLFYSDDRDDRVKDTAEVFTPDWLVQEMLDSLLIDWDNPPQNETFLDPTCGSGNFLVAVLKRGIPLDMIYGVDLMPDNVQTVKKRLLAIAGDTVENKKILDNNIRCEDAMTYDYQFDDNHGSSLLF